VWQSRKWTASGTLETDSKREISGILGFFMVVGAVRSEVGVQRVERLVEPMMPLLLGVSFRTGYISMVYYY
jgi:hypothetical protein